MPQPRWLLPPPPRRGAAVTALVRGLARCLPIEAASPPAWRRPEPDATLREVLGHGRLAAAVEHGDHARVDELLDVLLDHRYLGRRLAGRVIVRTGQAIAGPPSSEGSTP
jgi:hypothetical protein